MTEAKIPSPLASVAELLLRPSPGLILVLLALILSGRAGETALAVVLVLTVTARAG